MAPTPEGTSLAAFLQEVEGSSNALVLAERLMRYCRYNEATFHAWDADVREEAALPGLERQADLMFREQIDDFEFEPEDQARIVAFLRASDSIPPVVRAKVLLDRLAARYTAQIQATCSRRGAGPLQPEQLFPVFRPPVRDLVGTGDLSTNPDSRPQRLEYTPGLGLMPADLAGIQVEFDYSQEDQLCAFGTVRKPLRLAVGIVNASLNELTWDETDDPPPAQLLECSAAWRLG